MEYIYIFPERFICNYFAFRILYYCISNDAVFSERLGVLVKNSENTLLLEYSLTGFFIYLMKCGKWQGVRHLSSIHSFREILFAVLFWWCLTHSWMKRPIDLCYGSSFDGLFAWPLTSPLFHPPISFPPDQIRSLHAVFSTLFRLNVTIMTTMDLMIW